MSKTDFRQKAKELESYYNRFPEWYWKFGLHDAIILSLTETLPNSGAYTSKGLYNCLEISLNSADALFENDITKILLFNYKIKSDEISVSNFKNRIWLRDDISELNGGRYQLELVTSDSIGKHKNRFIINFEKAEIQRKN